MFIFDPQPKNTFNLSPIMSRRSSREYRHFQSTKNKSTRFKDNEDWTSLDEHLQDPVKLQMFRHHEEMIELRKTTKKVTCFNKTENWSDFWFWMTKQGIWFLIHATKFFKFDHPAMAAKPSIIFNDSDLVSAIWQYTHTQGRGLSDCPGFVTSTMKLCKCQIWDKPNKDFAKKWMRSHSFPVPFNRHDESRFWDYWFSFHDKYRHCPALTFDSTLAWRLAPSCLCPKI